MIEIDEDNHLTTVLCDNYTCDQELVFDVHEITSSDFLELLKEEDWLLCSYDSGVCHFCSATCLDEFLQSH